MNGGWERSRIRPGQVAETTNRGLPWHPRETDVHSGGRAREFDAFVAIRSLVEVIEEPLTAAEQDGHDHDMHVVDQGDRGADESGRDIREPPSMVEGSSRSVEVSEP